MIRRFAAAAVVIPRPGLTRYRARNDDIPRHWTCLATLLAVLFAGQANAATLRWISDPADARKVAVEVTELSAPELDAVKSANQQSPDWGRAWLSVYAEQGDVRADVNLPAMLGSYSVQSNVFRFAPRFPLEPGIRYRAVFRSGSGATAWSSVFSLPERKLSRTTIVSQVYPSGDVLPENLLKFYVHFSAPMSGGHIYDHVHLRDQNGKDVELPFLQIDEELWDPGMERLTLFIDPGRIKRGVQPHEEIGPALESGKSFTLIIDEAWKDAAGAPLKTAFQKKFRVTAPDREPPDQAKWKVKSPKRGTREPLVVTFPEPMDHALSLRMIQVVDPLKQRLNGEATLEDQERRWSFVPAHPWSSGAHLLVVQTIIEDLAGNNIGKPFEVDVFEKVQRQISTPTVELGFEIR